MPTYGVPGVYIEEQTGPGVITGVGTSTAAFIGPALKGPINEARRISSFEEFLDLYATAGADGVVFPYITEPKPFFMAHAVRGFFENGGGQAYIVRAGTGRRARLTLKNQADEPEPVFVVEAQVDGVTGDGIAVRTELTARQKVSTGSAIVAASGIAGNDVTVDDAGPFRIGDIVTKDNTDTATITQITGKKITLNSDPKGWLADDDTLWVANIKPAQLTFRMADVTGLRAGGAVLISGKNAAGDAKVDRAVIQDIDPAARTVTLVTDSARTNIYKLNVAVADAPTLTSQHVAAVGQAKVTGIAPSGIAETEVTFAKAPPFGVGDIVTKDNTDRATIIRARDNKIIVNALVAWLVVGDTLRIANLKPGDTTIRVKDVTGLIAGGIVKIEDASKSDFAIIQSVDSVTGIVTLRATPVRANTYDLSVAEAVAPTLTPWEFRLIVTPPPASKRPSGRFHNVSLESAHPRYIFNKSVLDEIQEFETKLVQVIKPPQPPTAVTFPERLINSISSTSLAGGADDQPTAVGLPDNQVALDVLRDIDDVNLICIPDAADHSTRIAIQMAIVNHCLAKKDRFAILDSQRGALPSGPGSVEQHRLQVQSEKGFAALYYPWLEVNEPIPPTSVRPLTPRTMLVPPSGHMAGVYARTDEERGVHKAPANATVRGVMGLERILSDGQHGPLNLLGVNVLRIFPGTAQVTVWGARTTVDPNINDRIYVNVRRLMLFLEETIEEGIRFAVFEPNNLALWQKLKRTINAFLSRVWREGALFGAKPEQAYYVRIDEALNPPSTRALGRLAH